MHRIGGMKRLVDVASEGGRLNMSTYVIDVNHPRSIFSDGFSISYRILNIFTSYFY